MDAPTPVFGSPGSLLGSPANFGPVVPLRCRGLLMAYGVGKWRPGRRLTEADLEGLRPGDVVWVHWCKDDDPRYERWNRPVQVTGIRVDARGRKVWMDDEGYDWSFDGNQSGRGEAIYYEAVRVDVG